MLWGSAGAAAIALVLRYIFSKARRAKFVTDFASVGRPTHGASESEPEEFDIIIVGGGKLQAPFGVAVVGTPLTRIGLYY